MFVLPPGNALAVKTTVSLSRVWWHHQANASCLGCRKAFCRYYYSMDIISRPRLCFGEARCSNVHLLVGHAVNTESQRGHPWIFSGLLRPLFCFRRGFVGQSDKLQFGTEHKVHAQSEFTRAAQEAGQCVNRKRTLALVARPTCDDNAPQAGSAQRWILL